MTNNNLQPSITINKQLKQPAKKGTLQRMKQVGIRFLKPGNNSVSNPMLQQRNEYRNKEK